MLLNPCVPSFCVLSVDFQIRTIHILKQTRQTSARNSSWPGKLQCLTLFLPSHNVSPATSLRQAPFHSRLENLLRAAPDASSSKIIIIEFQILIPRNRSETNYTGIASDKNRRPSIEPHTTASRSHLSHPARRPG